MTLLNFMVKIDVFIGSISLSLLEIIVLKQSFIAMEFLALPLKILTFLSNVQLTRKGLGWNRINSSLTPFGNGD